MVADSGWHSFNPLIAFNDPTAVWAAQPTFLIAEVLFLGLAVCGITDAIRRPRGTLLFIASLVGGSCIELVTIMHRASHCAQIKYGSEC